MFSLVHGDLFGDAERSDYVICAEKYGIPQNRHRIILLGVRDDIDHVKPKELKLQSSVPAGHVLSNLPRVRAGLSALEDSPEAWAENLKGALDRRWFVGVRRAAGEDVQNCIRDVLASLKPPENGRGGEFLRHGGKPEYMEDWFVDPRLDGVCNFSTRLHMPPDFHRYLFTSCFAEVRGGTPTETGTPARESRSCTIWETIADRPTLKGALSKEPDSPEGLRLTTQPQCRASGLHDARMHGSVRCPTQVIVHGKRRVHSASRASPKTRPGLSKTIPCMSTTAAATSTPARTCSENCPTGRWDVSLVLVVRRIPPHAQR